MQCWLIAGRVSKCGNLHCVYGEMFTRVTADNDIHYKRHGTTTKQDNRLSLLPTWLPAFEVLIQYSDR